MKDINEEMLDILEGIEFEEVPISEVELARIKRMQMEKLEAEKLKVKREKRKRFYTVVAASFVIALGIAFFMRGGQDGESNIATEDKDEPFKVTEVEKGKNIITESGEKKDDFEINDKYEPSGEVEIGEDKKEDTKDKKKEEKIDGVKIAEKEDDKKNPSKTPIKGTGTAGVDKSEVKNNEIEFSADLQAALSKVEFRAMVPRIADNNLIIEEITTGNDRITVLYSYEGKVITFKTSDKVMSSYIKDMKSVKLGGVNLKMGKTSLGEEYIFNKNGAYFKISIIGNIEGAFLEKFIKSIK